MQFRAWVKFIDWISHISEQMRFECILPVASEKLVVGPTLHGHAITLNNWVQPVKQKTSLGSQEGESAAVTLQCPMEPINCTP
jgi:hypothetical protein